MDVNLRFEGRAVRSVSLRQLSRRTTSLLEEILDDGGAVLVTRYGSPVALLSPLEDAQIDRMASRRAASEEVDEVAEVVPDLDARQRAVLARVVAKFPYSWNANDPWVRREELPATLVAMTKLELAGLVERVPLGLRATKLGKRAHETLSGADPGS